MFERTPFGALHRRLAPKQASAMKLMALLECSALFTMLVQVVLRRTLMHALTAYLYVSVLRLMFHSRETRELHRDVWRGLWATAGPLVARVPLGALAADRVARWFASV